MKMPHHNRNCQKFWICNQIKSIVKLCFSCSSKGMHQYFDLFLIFRQWVNNRHFSLKPVQNIEAHLIRNVPDSTCQKPESIIRIVIFLPHSFITNRYAGTLPSEDRFVILIDSSRFEFFRIRLRYIVPHHFPAVESTILLNY